MTNRAGGIETREVRRAADDARPELSVQERVHRRVPSSRPELDRGAERGSSGVVASSRASRATQVAELAPREIAAQQPETAIGRRDEPVRVNVFQR